MADAILHWEKDWQEVKDLMTFLETDDEREKLLSAAILSHSRL